MGRSAVSGGVTAADAGSTPSPALLSYESVVVVVGMPVTTVGEKNTLHASSRVLAWGNGFKVVRINTIRSSAEMVEGQITRNRAETELVGPPMGKIQLRPDAKLPVTIGHNIAGPQPTGLSKVNLRPKAGGSLVNGRLTEHRSISFGVALPNGSSLRELSL